MIYYLITNPENIIISEVASTNDNLTKESFVVNNEVIDSLYKVSIDIYNQACDSQFICKYENGIIVETTQPKQ